MNLSNGWPMMGSTGEIILFACTAIVMVACALGVLFFKKAAHSVICMVGVMLGLAVLYIANSAPFLGVAQIVVYTGAIMMLFLFVIMLIGIGTSDDYARQRRGAIVAAVLGGLGLIVILTTAIMKSVPATYAPQRGQPLLQPARHRSGNHAVPGALADHGTRGRPADHRRGRRDAADPLRPPRPEG